MTTTMRARLSWESGESREALRRLALAPSSWLPSSLPCAREELEEAAPLYLLVSAAFAAPSAIALAFALALTRTWALPPPRLAQLPSYPQEPLPSPFALSSWPPLL